MQWTPQREESFCVHPLDDVNIFVYFCSIVNGTRGAVKTSEFKRWLADQRATFEEGSAHAKVYLNGKQTTLPRHASQEIGEGLRRAILKQLGIK